MTNSNPKINAAFFVTINTRKTISFDIYLKFIVSILHLRIINILNEVPSHPTYMSELETLNKLKHQHLIQQCCAIANIA